MHFHKKVHNFNNEFVLMMDYLSEFIVTMKHPHPSKQGTISEPVGMCHVYNWYCSTSTCFHVFCLLSRVFNEFDTSRTGSELVQFHWHV